MQYKLFGFMVLVFITTTIQAQEEPAKNRHTLGLYQGATYIPNTLSEDTPTVKEPSFVSSIGLTYLYRLSPRWGLGMDTDIQLSKYAVEEGGTLLARDNVWVNTLQVYFEPFEGVNVFAGPGYEIERHENFVVLKTGIEAEMYVANGWWIIPEFSFEFKEVYSNWNVGFKIARGFGKEMER